MSARIAQHIRSNVYGLIAVFIALGGTALAVDGPLPGQNQVGSEDIINGEVKRDDIAGDAVRTGKVLNETLLGEDIAIDAIGASEIQTDAIGGAELGPDAVRGSNVVPNSLFGSDIADGSVTGDDVATNSLTGADIDETTLTALDGNDAHDQTCNPETTSFLHCVELSFTAGYPMPVLMMARYQYHGIEDNPLGTCRTTLDGATISSSKLFNSDHTSEIGGSAMDVVTVGAGSHTFGFDCFEFGPDDHDLVVTEIDLAEVQLGID